MDPLSCLPPECFERILVALLNDNSCTTLVALLQTNRYFATLTLPYLYRDPYRFASYEEGDRRPSYDKRRENPLITRIPTCALLNFLPPSTVLPKVLSLGVQPLNSSVTSSDTEDSSPAAATTISATTNTAARSLMFDYLGQIRHIMPQPWTIGLDQFWKWAQPPPEVLDFILTQEFYDLCDQANLIPTEVWYSHGLRNSPWFFQWCFQVLFLSESNWVLANPIMERLKSLTIPFSDLGRYLEPSTMCRMRRLERVTFILNHFGDKASDRSEYLERFKPLVRFVGEHSRLFPGVLKSVSTCDGTTWTPEYGGQITCPESVLVEISEMLPALARPTSVTTLGSILQLLAHTEETDISRLEELETQILPRADTNGETLFTKYQHILQRCRSLRRLRIFSTDTGSFQWAVDEKRRLMEQDRQESLAVEGGYMGEEKAQRLLPHQSEFWRKGLVPLEELVIYGFSAGPASMIVQVDNAAFAFNQTLRKIEAYDYDSNRSTTRRFGEGWVSMPVLTQLTLSVDRPGLMIDPHLFSFCPNVVSVRLCDYIKEYRCEDIEPCLPARLPRLKSMHLQGMSALSFHPDTLHSTTELTDLSVIVENFSDNDEEDDYDYEANDYEGDDFTAPYSFIPPLNELYRSYGIQDNPVGHSTPLPAVIRPNWTWDWDLPRLVSLKLSSEFAFLFQFCMLQGCPALKTLELEIRTYTMEPIRTIAETDLYSPSTGDPIVLPSLTKLRLDGSWKFPDLAFTLQFLTTMFPNLEILSAINWTGVTLRDMIQLVRGMPKPVKELVMDRRSNYLSEADRKLFWVHNNEQPVNQEQILTTVAIRRDWYYLMREKERDGEEKERDGGEKEEASHIE